MDAESQDEQDLIFLQSLAQDVFIARCKDNAELPRRQEAVFFRDTFLKHCSAGTVRLRSQRLGQCSCAAILKGLKLHKHVHTLDLYSNLVRDAGAFSVSTIIEQLPALTHLNLGGNDIRNDGAGHLARVLNGSKISFLELGSSGLADGSQALNKIDPGGAAALFSAAKHAHELSYLGLANNRVGLDDNEMAACSKMVKNSCSLRHLSLAFNSLSQHATQMLCFNVARSNSIATLDLSGNTLCVGSATAIAQLIEATGTLTVLKLSHNALGAEGVEVMCEALGYNQTIVALHLDNNSMEDLGAIAVAEMLKHNVNLTELSLCSNGICQDGALALGSVLEHNQTLSVLSLKGNPMHDELAMVLASMQNEQPGITSLDLRKTKLTDRGAQWLAASLSSCSHLERILLSDNLLTDACGESLIKAAAEHPALHYLLVQGNQLKHASMQTMKRLCKQNKTASHRREPNRMKRELHRLGHQEKQLNIAHVNLSQEQARQKKAENEASKIELEVEETHREHEKVLTETTSQRELSEANKQRIEAEIADKASQLNKKRHDNVAVESQFEKELAIQVQLREKAEAQLAALKNRMIAAHDQSDSSTAVAIRDVQTKTDELTKYAARKAAEFEALKKQVRFLGAGDGNLPDGVDGAAASAAVRGSSRSSSGAQQRSDKSRKSSNIQGSVGFGSGASNADGKKKGKGRRSSNTSVSGETRVAARARADSESSDQSQSGRASKLGFGIASIMRPLGARSEMRAAINFSIDSRPKIDGHELPECN